MKPIKKQNSWECLLYSFASVLDVDPQDIIDFIGHDGSQVINASSLDPRGRRGFHVQEIVSFVILSHLHNFNGITPFEVRPVSFIGSERLEITGKMDREHTFFEIIENNAGVVTGETKNFNSHAVAFTGGRVMDPDDGQIYMVSHYFHAKGFRPATAWMLI